MLAVVQVPAAAALAPAGAAHDQIAAKGTPPAVAGVERVGATLVVVQAAVLPVAVPAGVVRAVVVRVAGALVAAQAGVEALVVAAQAGVEALVAAQAGVEALVAAQAGVEALVAAQAGVEALVAAHLAAATLAAAVVRAVGYLNAAVAATNVTPERRAATSHGLAVVAVVGGETPAVARSVVVKIDEINRALFAVVVSDKHPPNEALLPFATAAQLS